jgi:hypothetical protein
VIVDPGALSAGGAPGDVEAVDVSTAGGGVYGAVVEPGALSAGDAPGDVTVGDILVSSGDDGVKGATGPVRV